uniref:NADH-ubiquinone oxidoreductase chain 6 n=1 Tax=Tettigonia chinensis TaxID=469653 RepID=A0A1Q1MPJ8_9ORTH|nr:NADH dehydrogenase subunit 6 [Tettigonia chinensis]
MLNLSIIILNSLNSLMFFQSTHPLSMTLIIIVQTCIISVTIGMLSSSFWFSYVLFLVFIGGMLVLFIYITSLASNELFPSTFKAFMITSLTILAMLALCYIMDPYFWNTFTKNYDIMPTDTLANSMNLEATPYLIKLYNYPNYFITLMLMNYLLFTLIVVVKITNIFQGPLRQNSYG